MIALLPPRRMRAWVYWAGVLVAIGLAYGAYAVVSDDRRMLTTGQAVEGRMTGSYERVQTTRGGRVVSTAYHPSFSFRTNEGKVVVAQVPDEVALADIQRDRTMALRYDPDDPGRIRLAAALEGGSSAGPWVLGLAALLLGVGSIPGMLNRRWAWRRPGAR